MSALSAATRAVWEFLVGDDWRAAAGVALALALVALLADEGLEAWWVMPPAVLGLLALSVRRELRSAAGTAAAAAGRVQEISTFADSSAESPSSSRTSSSS